MGVTRAAPRHRVLPRLASLITLVALLACSATHARAKELESDRAGVLLIGQPVVIDGPGTLSSAAIAATLGTARSRIERCYADVLRREPAREGRLTATFNIQGDGLLIGFSVFENTAGPGVERCVLDGIRELRFPPPSGGHVVVTCPFRFRRTSAGR